MKKIKKILSLLLILSMVLVGYLGNGNEALAEVEMEDKKLIFNIHLIELNPIDFFNHNEYKEGYDGGQIESLTEFFGNSAKLVKDHDYTFIGTIGNSSNEKVVEGSYENGVLTFNKLPKYDKNDPYIVKIELKKEEGKDDNKLKKAIPMEFQMPDLGDLEKKTMHLYPKITEEASTISKRLKVNLDDDNNFIPENKNKVRYFEEGEIITWFARLNLINAEDIKKHITSSEGSDGIWITDIRNSDNIHLSKKTTIKNPKAYLSLKIDGIDYSKDKTFDIKNPIRNGDKILIEEEEIKDFIVELTKKLPNIEKYKFESKVNVEEVLSELDAYCFNETVVEEDDLTYDLSMSVTFELDGYVLESISPGNYENDLACGDLLASECDGIDEFNVADYDVIKVSTSELDENGSKKRLGEADFKLLNSEGLVLVKKAVTEEEGKQQLIWMKEEDIYGEGTTIRIFTSNEEGEIKVPGLGDEEYRLVEVKAPEGYHMDPKNPGNYTTSLVIDKLGQIIEIPNTKLTIPPTGGIGTIVFVLLGLGLLSFAAITISKDKKKTKEI